MAAVGGDEVREGCGENVGPVTHCAAALVNELQFLVPNLRDMKPQERESKRVGEWMNTLQRSREMKRGRRRRGCSALAINNRLCSNKLRSEPKPNPTPDDELFGSYQGHRPKASKKLKRNSKYTQQFSKYFYFFNYTRLKFRKKGFSNYKQYIFNSLGQ